ncbi:MAG: hypothetical protein PHH26_03425 [Candidatus Thermoplasmatota archaeon]|nr:hypothetical protein [Candidatus Thermoplasmatota archaeon]
MDEKPTQLHEKPKFSRKQRANRIMQYIRDIPLIPIGAVLMSTSYGKWVDEPAHYVLFGIAGALALLSVINTILLLAKVKRKGYFYFNAIFQLPVAFILAGLGATAPVGIPLLALNIAILATMRDKKPKQN